MKTKQIIRTLTLLFFLSGYVNVEAQVKEMIDLNDIKSKAHNKYKSTSGEDVRVDEDIEVTDDYGSSQDYECLSKAINYGSLLMETERIKSGIKKSAETTVKVFGSTLKTFGFGYLTDGVKILSLLDEVQKEGGDADDFAKAIAKYAFGKGSSALLNKAKEKAPNLFDGETLSGEGLSILADLAKTESGKFFDKLISPSKEVLFDYEGTSTYCTEYYYGEISSNSDNDGNEIIEDHIGPIVIIRIGFNCKCRKDKTNELKRGIVRYNIPLDLVKNPNAWPIDSWKRKAPFVTTPPDYIYSPIKEKITVKVTAECCDKGNDDEDVSYIDPLEQPDQTIGYNVGLGFQNDFEDVSYCAGVEYLKRISDKKSDTYIGGGISYIGTSFNDFKTSTVMVGPKVQIHTPISHSGDTQWVNGLKGYFMFGNQKNGNLKDKTSGVEASIYSGFNIQLNKKTSIGVEFPVFTWEKIKIKPEVGADYEVDGTSLLLNKGNPLKLSIRHSF